jgi:nucleoside-diphosphate-sugar epimerase
MRVLVAGGSGFIGKNLLLKIPSEWECVGTYNTSYEFPDFVKSNNLSHVTPSRVEMRDIDSVKTVFKKTGTEFDVCLYVMGNSDIGLSRREPLTDLSYNINSLLNLIQTVKVGKFIFMSSGSVYEGHKGLVNPFLRLAPAIPYSVNKLASERYIEYFQKYSYHIDNFICLRFFGAYGPMEPARKLYTNLIKAFYIEDRNDYTVLGNGKNFIDAMYIDDAIEALLKIAVSDKDNVIADLCFGYPLTINELVIEVGRIFGKKITLKHEGSAAEYTTFYASTDTMESLFGFRPGTSLSTGMMNLARYISNHLSRK